MRWSSTTIQKQVKNMGGAFWGGLGMLREFLCRECGWMGQVEVKEGIARCPLCKAVQDVWEQEQEPPYGTLRVNYPRLKSEACEPRS